MKTIIAILLLVTSVNSFAQTETPAEPVAPVEAEAKPDPHQKN